LEVVSNSELDIVCTLEQSNFLLLKKIIIIQIYGKKEFYAKPVVNGIDFIFLVKNSKTNNHKYLKFLQNVLISISIINT